RAKTCRLRRGAGCVRHDRVSGRARCRAPTPRSERVRFRFAGAPPPRADRICSERERPGRVRRHVPGCGRRRASRPEKPRDLLHTGAAARVYSSRDPPDPGRFVRRGGRPGGPSRSARPRGLRCRHGQQREHVAGDNCACAFEQCEACNVDWQRARNSCCERTRSRFHGVAADPEAAPALTSERLRRLRAPCLAITLAISAWLGLHAARIGVEHDNSSLRSTDPADRRSYEDFKATFGSDEDILVAIAHPQLLDARGLGLIADVTSRIQAMDGVRKAWSLVNVEEIASGETGAEPHQLLAPPWDSPDIRERTLAALERNPDFTGWLVSADRKTAGIVVEIEDRPD